MLALLLYLPTLGYDFVYDDIPIVEYDQRLTEGSFGYRLWVSPYWPQGSVAPASRPVATWTYWLQTQLHGQSNPLLFRLVNVLLFAVLAMQVAFLAVRWTGNPLSGWLAGPLFAIHPLRVEIVAGLVGRAEILAAMFALLALQLWLRWRQDPSWKQAVAIGLCVLFAGWSKEHGFLIAPIIGLAEWAMRRSEKAKVWAGPWPWKTVGMVVLVAVVAFGQRLAMSQHSPQLQVNVVSEMDNPLGRNATTTQRLVTPLMLVGKATQLSLFPFENKAREGDGETDTPPQWGIANSPDYSPPMLMPVSRLGDPLVLLGLCVVGVWVAGVAVSWRMRWRVLGPLLAIPVAWAIPSNTVLIIGTIFAERLLTFVSIFCWISLGGMVRPGMRMKPMAATAAVAVAMVFLFMATTWFYSVRWKDHQTLVVTTISAHPTNGRFRGYLAKAMVEQGLEHPEVKDQSFAAAEKLAWRALRDWPRQADPYGVLAFVAEHRGDRNKALMYAKYAREANSRNNLGDYLLEVIGEKPPDEKLLQEARQLVSEHGNFPEDIQVRHRLANVFRLLKNYRDSVRLYQSLVDYHGEKVEEALLEDYLEVLQSSEQFAKALSIYKMLIDRQPNSVKYLTNGAILAIHAKQDLPLAKQWLGKVLQAFPGQVEALVALGDLHLQQGDLSSAGMQYEKALALVGHDDYRSFQIRVQLEKVRR